MALLQLVHHAVAEPAEKSLVVLRKRVQDPVHALADEGVLVQLDLVGGELADLLGKGFQRLLEEAVYCAHGEGAVVVEDVEKNIFGLFLQSCLSREQGRYEVLGVLGFSRLRGELVEFLEDPAFHLVGRLVRESHGKDVPVGSGILILQEEFYVSPGQVESLSGTG